MTEFLVAANRFVWGAALTPAVVNAARQTLNHVIRAEARVRLVAPETVRRESSELGQRLQRLVMHFEPQTPKEAWIEAGGLIQEAQKT